MTTAHSESMHSFATQVSQCRSEVMRGTNVNPWGIYRSGTSFPHQAVTPVDGSVRAGTPAPLNGNVAV
jgi:hypothetical protein